MARAQGTAGTQAPDLCVVGGGIVGTATAYYAARAGLSVLLLEASELASGPSGAAFGGVSAHIYSYADTVVPEPYVRLSLESIELYGRLQEELGEPLDFAPVGQIDPFFDDGDRPSREERVRGLRAAGVPVELLTRDELREVEPALSPEIAGGTHCPVDGMVSPQCAVQALADGAVAHGAEIRTGAAVDSLLVTAGRVRGVRTAAGDVAAGAVVVCAGARTAELLAPLGVTVPLHYSKGQLFVTERRPRVLRTALHHVKQTTAGTFVMGITREVFDMQAERIADLRTTPSGFAEVMRSAVRTVPALAGVRVVRSWAGEIVIPADGYPVLGAVPGTDGAFVGVANRGVAMGPATGRLLASLVSGDPMPELYERFSAARFEAPTAPLRERYYGGHLGVG